MSRDLIGYGDAWPDPTWPNGAKLAVSVVVNVEEGAEQQVLDDDPASERIGELLSVVPEGRPDPGQAQIFAYGSCAGAWRMSKALRSFRVPATPFACGRAAGRAAPALCMLTEDGHETACHGWLWRPRAEYGRTESEAADLDRAAKAALRTTGERPRGISCRGAESPWTRSLLVERSHLYTSNGFDGDLPYRDASGLIVVLFEPDANEMKCFHPDGFVRAADMIDYVTDALNVLVAEAAQRLPRALNIGFHLRIVGRPGRFKSLEHVLAKLDRGRDRLWLARRVDIAQVFDAACPA